jgi:hypothetical protein
MKTCKLCNKEHTNKVYCSKGCYSESLKGIRDKKAPNYKKKVGKSQVHKWLSVHYGKPQICEIGKCTMESKVYDWALKKGRTYLRKRDSFLRLCRSCHRRYDLTPQKRLQAIKNLIKHSKFQNENSYAKYKKLVGRV